MKRYVIDSVRDIHEFLSDLYLRIRKPLLPEDDLAEVVDAAGIVIFSGAEAAYFDDVMLDCFVFCNDYHLDLHAIAEAVQRELYVGRRSVTEYVWSEDQHQCKDAKQVAKANTHTAQRMLARCGMGF